MHECVLANNNETISLKTWDIITQQLNRGTYKEF